MGCTTILVGKDASNDGSTIMARTEDAGSGTFSIKKYEVIEPQTEPSTYRAVISHVEIPLPAGGLRYTRFPDVAGGKGLWAGAGINSACVSMTATETLTTNERVLAADPLVELVPAQGKEGEADYVPEQPGGIGEEDMVILVLPYVNSAREGVLRLGELLEKYGTYEMNGIGFADQDEVWWLETIGGHHWIARRVPDDAYAVIANQFSIDFFDFRDAFDKGEDYLCSRDLREFIDANQLNLDTVPDFDDMVSASRTAFDSDAEHGGEEIDLSDVVECLRNTFNPRLAFGSHSDTDHVYNTPRVWALQQYFTPEIEDFMDDQAYFAPDSDDLEWCLPPKHKITMEDVKYVLSYHYQGTPYNPYARERQAIVGGADRRGMYRPIGINRTNFTAALQLRSDMPAPAMGLNWVAFGAMPFNAMVPFYANVRRTPEYLGDTTARVTTEKHYWHNRIIAALADAHFHEVNPHIQRYQQSVTSKARAIVAATDKAVEKLLTGASDTQAQQMENTQVQALLEEANEKIANLLQRETDDLLDKVLYEVSMHMHNAFSLDDA